MDADHLVGAFTAILRTKMSFLPVHVGLERGVEDRSLAWALDFPGAFACGKNDTEALAALPQALAEFESWIGQHDNTNQVSIAEFKIQVEESFDSFVTDENVTVNAFFEDDRRPLRTVEIEQALKIHTWQRQDLLAGVRNLDPEMMTRMLPGQRWNINGILNHIGRTEIRYLGYLDLPLPTAELLVHNPFKILEFSYTLVQKTLPRLAGNTAVLDQDGELWSARKLVRRLLWHQHDHIEHIQQIVEIANQ